jgi:hypothetical protein
MPIPPKTPEEIEADRKSDVARVIQECPGAPINPNGSHEEARRTCEEYRINQQADILKMDKKAREAHFKQECQGYADITIEKGKLNDCAKNHLKRYERFEKCMQELLARQLRTPSEDEVVQCFNHRSDTRFKWDRTMYYAYLAATKKSNQ